MLWGLEFPYEVSAALIDNENIVSEEVHFLDQKSHLVFLQATVERLWERDRVVISGRGSMMILKGRPRTLSIRTVAPMAFPDRKHRDPIRTLPGEKAIDRIQKDTKRRAAYIKANYGVDWEDPTLYHLVLNTDQLGIEGASQVIVEAVKRLEA